MLRRLLLVGVFVVIKPGSVEQLAYATLVNILYLAIQMNASPFESPYDGFMASSCSMSLTVLFVLCGWYKFGALTQLEKVQGVMSPELKKDFLASYVSLSGILWLASLGAFLVLGLVVGKLARDEAKRRRHEAKSAVARRLRYLDSHEEVLVEEVLDPLPLLEELKRRLYVDLTTTPVSHLPHAGPFHIFLRWPTFAYLHTRTFSCLRTRTDPRHTSHTSVRHSRVSCACPDSLACRPDSPVVTIGSMGSQRCALSRRRSKRCCLDSKYFWVSRGEGKGGLISPIAMRTQTKLIHHHLACRC